MKKLSALLLICVMIFSGCTIKTADDYYSTTEKSGNNKITLNISCQTAAEYPKSNRKKADILKDYVVYTKDNSTVFNVLKTACKENKIQLDFSGSGTSVYIKAIDYLYEFDCGDLSGWQYNVNGEYLSVGCGSSIVKDGDTVNWLYTCDLGEDIGNFYTE